MKRQFVIVLSSLLFSYFGAIAQFESDSMFTWKQLISTDLTSQANIQFIPKIDVVPTSWAFGDGRLSTDQSPVMLFTYLSQNDSISVVMNYMQGDESKSVTRIIPLSPASFWVTYDEELHSLADFKKIFVSTFCLENTVTSIGNLRFSWSVDGENVDGHYFTNSALGQWPNIYYTFASGGSHLVGLSVYDINAQTNVASFVQTVILPELEENQKLENIPNVFTPNNDGINDFFEVSSSGTSWFVMRIFSRTGALLYQNEASIIQWNGRNNQGKLLPDGVYFYVIEDKNNVYQPATGFVYIYGEK